MVSRRCWGAAVAALALLGASQLQAAPLEAYGRLPSLEQVALSPAGDMLAFVTDLGGQRTIVVQGVDSAKPILVAPVGSQKLRDLIWADQQHILVTTSVSGHAAFVLGPNSEWYLTSLITVTDHRVRHLLDDTEGDMNVTSGTPRPRMVKGRETVFVAGVHFPMQNTLGDAQGQLALYSVDAVTGASKLVEEGSPDARSWVIDENGKVVAETDYSQAKKRWTLRLQQNGVWRDALQLDAPIDTPDVEGIGPDGRSLLVDIFDKDSWQVRPVGLADGKLGDPIDRAEGFYGIIADPKTHRVIGGRLVSMKSDYRFFDPNDQAVWTAINKAFPGEEVDLESWSDDRQRIVVHVVGPGDGDVFGLVDLKTGQTSLLGPEYKDVAAEEVAEVQTITYRAADGREIDAYLTLPKGRDPKKLPLVLLPHGGPASRDDPGFDWWSQALASRGYAVLQPQFRGSDGFGEDLLSAGYGQWGHKMESDLADGARDLAGKGLVDPKRVCIVGASYGGYAALAGVTLDPGVYRCAVSVAGISDLHRFLSWEKNLAGGSRNTSTMRFWDRFMGATGPDDPALDAISPIKRLEKLDAPVLLIHGRDDTVVPFEQSQIMADAMKKAGKSVEFVALPGEDHWLSRSETRLQMLEATVKFLQANNPPD